MTQDNRQFESSLAESLSRLAGAAPAGPDAARVVGALRRRRVVRGVVASAAACVLLVAGALTWYCRPGPKRHAAVPEIASPVLPIAPPEANRFAPLSFAPAMPALAFDALAVAMPMPAVRMEDSSLSTLGSLRGPPPPCAMNYHLPNLSLNLGGGTTKQTPNERTLQ